MLSIESVYMSKIKTFLNLGMVVWMLLYSGCGFPLAKNPKEQAFANIFPNVNMNQYLKLTQVDDPGFHTTNLVQPIFLLLENISLETIQMPPDYGNKVLLFQEKNINWLSIANSTEYLSKDNILLNPKNQFRSGTALSVTPTYEGIEDLITVRVVLIGQILKDGKATDQKVGAFADVELHR